jgi:hypothetical protein
MNNNFYPTYICRNCHESFSVTKQNLPSIPDPRSVPLKYEWHVCERDGDRKQWGLGELSGILEVEVH